METQKFDLFCQKSSKLNFVLCWRADINIEVGHNMNLYDPILIVCLIVQKLDDVSTTLAFQLKIWSNILAASNFFRNSCLVRN